MTSGQKAAATRKRRAAAAKAARTRKLRAAGKKAATTRKRRAAGRKAAQTKKRNAARAGSGVHAEVQRLGAEVAAGRIGRAQPWGGADVVLSDTPAPPSDERSFYPDKRYVVTPFVAELSWLFESLRDAFGSAIDYQSKYAFYGRLADAADRYSSRTSGDSQSPKGLLGAVLAEAKAMSKGIC